MFIIQLNGKMAQYGTPRYAIDTDAIRTAGITELEQRLQIVDFSTLPMQATEAECIKKELRRRRRKNAAQ